MIPRARTRFSKWNGNAPLPFLVRFASDARFPTVPKPLYLGVSDARRFHRRGDDRDLFIADFPAFSGVRI